MKILDCKQGDASWHAARAKYYRTASRAPIMMGASLYGMTRNDLMAEIKSGVVKDIDANTQALFDAGHAAEDGARMIVEGHLHNQYGHPVPLLPLTCITDDEYLLASFDGINEDFRVGFEHKLANEKLFAQIRAKSLDPFYYWQLEQLILVGNLEYIIFMCSDGTKERAAYLKYVPVPGRAEQLIAGWKQFEVDLAGYKHVEVIPAATAVPVMALPALSIQVNGAITLTDNLKVFGERLEAFIAGIDKNPSTDQAFADCEAAVKTLEKAQEALEAAESSALAQTASIDEMRRTVALYAGQARSTRLMLAKLVATRKETIRIDIVQGCRTALAEHVAGLTKRLGKPYMPPIAEDFAGVIKGKKTITSLRDAVDTELARCKIAANEVADRIQLNLIALRDAGTYHFLFADAAQIVLKAPDDLTALVKVRIADHVAAEAKRLEAEREKIRQEEADKLRRETEAKKKAEDDALALAQREQEERERKAKEPAAAQVVEVATPDSATSTKAPLTPAPVAAPVGIPDADTILLDFKERFGRRQEFAGVTREIIQYFKTSKKKVA